MISFARSLWRNYTSAQWERWWQNRKIDWREAYLSTWNHPHRDFISAILQRITWLSLLEIGCGAGANLANIVKHVPGRQLGGIDINPEAIKVAEETFHGCFLKVCPAHDVMMSDSSVDLVLTDMTLIYYGPRRVHEVIEEIKRIGRTHVVLCEFHSESVWERAKLFLRSGYHAHNYRTLLEKHGFHDVTLVKVPEEAWPGSDTNQPFRYVVVAKIPRRK